MPVALGLYALKESGELGELKRNIRTWAKADPMDALFTTVFGGGLAFYLAERDTNPNCVNAWDGILYMSTALSVGYDNLFPTTPIGHALATFAQTFGPALAGAALDAPAGEEDADAATNRAILARLDDVVRLLSAQRPG
ncbi:MAG TPA: hypothetical protein VGM39_15060 [Kofleriaceae bacterium]